jgi:hypothetical protein
MRDNKEKSYWFRDNWVGDIHYFSNLIEARESAKAESAIKNITIHGENGYSETVETEGYIYP